MGHHPRHKPNAQRFVCIDDIAGEQQLGGLLTADELSQTAKARHIADQPAQHKQLTKLGALTGHTNIGHQRKLHAPTDRGTIDCRNHRNVGVQQRVGSGGEPRLASSRADRCLSCLAGAHHLSHIVAAAKRWIGTRNHQTANT
ncbi:unannotated protein [freshwater metagenome]|uniref:Unannotated protein n=1 Tax=freshwater metagenome TaxID=449393 RepID=A0A6J6NU66_9ZZZZ